MTSNNRLLYGGSMKKKKSPASAAAAVLGRIGGRVRVPKGLAKLSSKRRSQIARMGAKARWGKKRRAK